MHRTLSVPALAASLALSVASLGCDDASTDPPPPPAPTDADHFDVDADGSGPRLWVEAADVSAGAATFELWAAELGPTFGWSAHLTFDEEHLALDPSVPPMVEPTVLGPGGDAEAAHLAVPRGGHVALGSTRRARDLGDVTIDAPVRLAAVRLAAADAGASRVAPARAIVRTAEGGWVAVTTAGGTFTSVGGAP